MHAIVCIYGKEEIAEKFLADVRSQKLPITYTNRETGENMVRWIDCQFRRIPGGFIDIIFPREWETAVLTCLGFYEEGGIYDLDLDKSYFGIKPLQILKSFLKIEEAKKITFATDQEKQRARYIHVLNEKKEILCFFPLLWTGTNERDWLTIIPIGVKYDGEIQEIQEPFKGWWHERI